MTRDMESQYIILLDIVKNKLSYAAHDLDHVLRVFALCQKLADKNVNPDVLLPAALLHDIARRLEDEDPTGKIDHAVTGAEMADGILKDLGYTGEVRDEITHCIRTHRFRSGFHPQTWEAKILFDADKLDVVGAVGIARSFMLAGKHGERLYRNISLGDYVRENLTDNGRIINAANHAANLEYELKLRKIPGRLYTDKGRELAAKRVKYMEDFFRYLKEEINEE